MACGEDTKLRINACNPSGVASITLNGEEVGGGSYFLYGDIGNPTGDSFSVVGLEYLEDVDAYGLTLVSKKNSDSSAIHLEPDLVQISSTTLNLANFGNSRDDSGVNTLLNFLSTNINGDLQSIPIGKLLDAIPDFVNNGAAISGGLTVGQTYYNSTTEVYTRVV